MTPAELAAEIGRSQKVTRAWLRRFCTRPEWEKNEPWIVGAECADKIRRHSAQASRRRVLIP